MGNFLHRTNKQYLASTDPNGLPESLANYISEPDMSAVIGQPTKYWVISGDTVSLVDQSTRDAIDAALLEAQKDSLIAELDQFSIMKAVALTLLDAINVTRVADSQAEISIAQFKTAAKAKLGN